MVVAAQKLFAETAVCQRLRRTRVHLENAGLNRHASLQMKNFPRGESFFQNMESIGYVDLQGRPSSGLRLRSNRRGATGRKPSRWLSDLPMAT
jgi:hypothetical protein